MGPNSGRDLRVESVAYFRSVCESRSLASLLDLFLATVSKANAYEQPTNQDLARLIECNKACSENGSAKGRPFHASS